MRSAINTEKQWREKQKRGKQKAGGAGGGQGKRMNEWVNVCECRVCTESLYLCFSATVQ